MSRERVPNLNDKEAIELQSSEPYLQYVMCSGVVKQKGKLVPVTRNGQVHKQLLLWKQHNFHVRHSAHHFYNQPTHRLCS